MFARILVPLDGSPEAEAILPRDAEPTGIHGAETLLPRAAWMPLIPAFMLRKNGRGMPVKSGDGSPSWGSVSFAAPYVHGAERIADHAGQRRADRPKEEGDAGREADEA